MTIFWDSWKRREDEGRGCDVVKEASYTCREQFTSGAAWKRTAASGGGASSIPKSAHPLVPAP